MIPELSTKINNYASSHDLTTKSQGEILSAMLIEGVISQAEYNEAMNETIFPNAVQNGGVGDVVLVSNTVQTPKSQAPKKRTHPVFKNIALDSSGKIDMIQFSKESILAKYPPDRYTFEETKDDGAIIYSVTDKQTGKMVYNLMISRDEYGNDNYNLSVLDRNGEITSSVTIKDGNIISYFDMRDDAAVLWESYVDGDTSKVSLRCENTSDGGTVVTSYDDLKVADKRYYDSDGNFIRGVLYNASKPYGECDENGNVTRSYIIDEITKLMDCDDESNTSDKLLAAIRQKITPDTILRVVRDYGEFNQTSFIEDIIGSDMLSEHQQKEIGEYLYSMMGKVLCENPQTTKLKTELLFSAVGDDAAGFKDKILRITPENAYDVVSSFGSFDSDEEFYAGKQSLSTLLTYINSSSMSDGDKSVCIRHITDCLIKYNEQKGIYTNDIKEDVNAHFNDPKKLQIDYFRLVSRASSDPSEEPVSVPNGELDLDFVQGNVGDCWLITGLKSINRTDNGKRFLNSLLSVDNENKTVTVKFPGVSKSYVITFDEISNFNHLAAGDGDVRAIEIAMDKYIKEMAYRGDVDLFDESLTEVEKAQLSTTIMLESWDNSDSDSPDRYDLNADRTELLYRVLLGDSSSIDHADMMKSDFNIDNAVFTLSVSDDNAVPAYNTVTSEETSLESRHAYVVDSSDEEFIYLIDPRDRNSQKIKVLRENFEHISVEIESSGIPLS